MIRDLFAGAPTIAAEFGLTWLCQSSALLALGLLAGRLLRRSGPAVQSAAYRTTLAAVLVCPIASALLARAGFNGVGLRLPARAAGELDPVPSVAASSRTAPAGPLMDRSPSAERQGRPDPGPAEGPPPPAIEARTSTPPVARTTNPERRASLTDWLPAMVAAGLMAWALGTFLLGARMALATRRMGRLRASAIPAGPAAEALCLDLAGRMRLAPPKVLHSPFLASPCVDGLFRPAILLPEDAEGADLHATFVHELAHLARRDGLWNLLRGVASGLLWFQPLLWALSRRMEVAAEEVCDDFVVQFGGDRTRYAGLLLELAGRSLPPLSPTGVGMVSLRSLLARRVVRILDRSRVLSTRVGRRGVAATLAAGLCGTLLVGMLGVGVGKRAALAQSPAKPAGTKSEPDDKTVRGQVVGPDGKPVPGAVVIVSHIRSSRDVIGRPFMGPKQYQFARKATDQDGRFEVSTESPKSDARADADEPGPWGFVGIIATAPGYGLGHYLKGQPVRLTADDVPVNGRLVDLEGRPVAGVKVRLLRLFVPYSEESRKAVGRGGPLQVSVAESLGLNGEQALPGGVTTDADGRFRIEGLGRDVLAELEISDPRLAFKRVRVVTREMDRIMEIAEGPGPGGLDEPGQYGADCTIAVEPSRAIEGFVRDLETGEPIPGAIVTAGQLAGSNRNIEGEITNRADARGRYRLIGLPKANGHKLSVYPPLDRPYFITESIEVPARPGLEPVPFDIALRRGIWITGRVTDVKTSKPVAASVDYFPFIANDHAKDYPNFRAEITASVGIKTRYRTDRDGRFRIVGLPGGGVVTAHADDKDSYLAGGGAETIEGRMDHAGLQKSQLLTYDRIFPALYHGLKEVNVPEGAASITCDLGLDPGGSVRVRLIDEAGKPVVHAVVFGRSTEGSDYTLDGDESVARIGGLVPGRARLVSIQHRDRKIGAVLTIGPDGPKDGSEITATLRPTAMMTGRLVDAAGKPASGIVRVELIRSADSFFPSIPASSAKLDAEGRFRCEVIPAGGPYKVNANDGSAYGFRKKMEPDAFKPFELAKDLTVEPGQAVDLGTFEVSKGTRIEAAKAEAADVPITGRIIDLEGRPVAGVSVYFTSARGPKSGDLGPWIAAVEKGEPPHMAYRHINEEIKIPEVVRRDATTDRDGRFRLEGIGAERVVTLKVRGESVAFDAFEVMTRQCGPIAAKGFPSQYGPGSETVHGADFTYAARPSRPVEGIVRDAGTGRPMEGVSVESNRFAGSDFGETRLLKSRTDAQGKFRLVGLPKGEGNGLLALPNDDQPYFMREVSVPDAPGVGPVSVDVELHRGLWITGKVTDKETGEPVKEARLHYFPFLGNKFVQALPEFDRHGNVNGTQMRYTTADDGSFKLVGMPGRAIVGVDTGSGKSYRSGVGSESIAGMDKNGFFKTYNNPIWPGRSWPLTMKEIDPAEGTEVVPLDLQLDPGPSVKIRVLDPEGKPVAGASLAASDFLRRDQVNEGAGEYLLPSFNPDEERRVIVRHESRKLARVIRVRAGADKDGPVVVALEPMARIKGRTVDADGQPLPGARVRPDLLPGGNFHQGLGEVVSDRDGRFEVADVPTGCDYNLFAQSGTMIKEQRRASVDAKVRPGETTDVGDIRFEKE